MTLNLTKMKITYFPFESFFFMIRNYIFILWQLIFTYRRKTHGLALNYFIYFFTVWLCICVQVWVYPFHSCCIFFSALSYSSQGVQVLNLSVEMTIENYNFEHSLLEMHFFYVNVTKRWGRTVHAAVRLLYGLRNITPVVAVRTCNLLDGRCSDTEKTTHFDAS